MNKESAVAITHNAVYDINTALCDIRDRKIHLVHNSYIQRSCVQCDSAARTTSIQHKSIVFLANPRYQERQHLPVSRARMAVLALGCYGKK